MNMMRTRWAALGAAVAVSLGAGGIGLITAAPLSSGERTVLVPADCRLADTRPAPDNVGTRNTPIGAGATVTFGAHGTNGNCTIPADATALSLNVTALNVSAPLTFLTLWNADAAAQPTTSSLNPAAGEPPTPNSVIVDLSATGQFKLFNALGTVDVIIDVTGYYQDHNHDDRYYTKTETYTKAEADAVSGALDSRVTALETTAGTLGTRVTALESTVAGLVNSAAASSSTGGSIGLTTTAAVVQSVTLTPPADGVVVVDSQATLTNSNTADVAVQCGITTSTTAIDAAYQQYVTVSHTNAFSEFETINGTRAFDVTDGVGLTVNLVCKVGPDTAPTASISARNMTAVFVPG
jgi:hypothetical protein